MTDTPSLSPTTVEPLDEVGGRALVEAWRLSGLTGAAYCRANDLRPQRLHYWRERLGYPIKVVGGERRMPASVPAPRAEGFVQMVVGGPGSRAITTVDIVIGDALIRVQAGFDTAVLKLVIAALRGEG